MLPPEFEEMFDALNWFREQYGLSHAGTVERYDRTVLVWGVRHPAPEIYHFNLYLNTFDPITKDIWEALTDHPAPWPWNKEGTGMDYLAAEPVWWEGMLK